MFGIHAYIAFTLDKVVTYAVRQVTTVHLRHLCKLVASGLEGTFWVGNVNVPSFLAIKSFTSAVFVAAFENIVLCRCKI
jgi:hypothetical protein